MSQLRHLVFFLARSKELQEIRFLIFLHTATNQMGKGRTTVGLVTACLIKEIQITTELRSVELHEDITITKKAPIILKAISHLRQ